MAFPGSFQSYVIVFLTTSAIVPASTFAGGVECNRPGTDIIVGDLHQVADFGSVGNIAAFAVGTTACNVGDVEFVWQGITDRHPVIAQNMYRLKEGRFEHIGMSWLKHGFGALQQDACGCGCTPSGDFHLLGVGCSDPYGAQLNGSQGTLGDGTGGLGRRSEVNPFTGEFTWPYTGSGLTGDAIYKRLQVDIADLDPAQAGGGLYFIEGHYVAQDDAAAGNQHNNASYRPILVGGAGATWSIQLSGVTEPESPAIRAWQANDPEVVSTDFEVPGDGMLILASKATDLGGGVWHYEYALHNLNVHRAVGSLAIAVDPATTVTGIEFHDVPYHSGEPFDGTDWPGVASAGSVSWATDTFTTDPNANALRWGTLYNFRFDANGPPGIGTVTMGLFKPGTPTTVTVAAVVPDGDPPICGNDEVEFTEECDPPDGLHCDDGCQWICGDGVVQEGEACDDGGQVAGDGCDELCQPETNDACADAIPIATGLTPFDTTAATTDGIDHGVGSCHPTVHGNLHNDLWYHFVPECDGEFRLTTCEDIGGSGNFDTRIAVYDGCDTSATCTNVPLLGCNDDDPDNPCGGSDGGFKSTVYVELLESNCYTIRVGAFDAPQSGSGELLIQAWSDTALLCTGAEECADGGLVDGIRDDNCLWSECSSCGFCDATDIAFADMGGSFGGCPPDGFVNIHDRNHALTCFAGTNPCAAINLDAAGAFGACPPDGHCNIHDANHVLAVFAGTSTCSCPGGPAPEITPQTVGQATLFLKASHSEVLAGEDLIIRVFVDSIDTALRSYQLDADVSGGRSASFELVKIGIEPRKDWTFFDIDGVFDATNETTGQMLAGLEADAGVRVTGSYLATYTYRASRDAVGTFVFDLNSGLNGHTYLVAPQDGRIVVKNTSPAFVEVIPRPIRPR
jgi:cysteine-rich repeat protein